MALLNLPQADGSSSGSGGGTDTLDDLADRMAKRRKKQQEDEAVVAQRKQEEQQKTTTQKETSPAPDKKSLPDRIAAGFVDIFKANTDADKQRRKEAGQAIEYKDQQADKKKTATEFKDKNQPSAERGATLSFNKGDVDARRDFYKTAGVDIDQTLSDKKAYDKVLEQIGGDPTSAEGRAKLARMTANNQIPEEAKRYQSTKNMLEKTEGNYQRNLKAQAGAENVVEQAERNFVRGAGEPIASLPADLQTAAGVVVKAIAPAGSRIQKAGDKLYEGGTTARDDLANKIVASGYTSSPNDSQFVAGAAGGAGSLLASLSAAKAFRSVTAPAALFGVEAGTDQAVAAKEAGLNDVGSALIGFGSGMAEGLLEQIGLEKFLGATGTPVKQAITRMVTEGTQEAAQSLAQTGFKAIYSDVDLGQAITQAVQEGGLGALIGGGASLPLSISEQLQAQGVDHKDAAQVAVNVSQRIEAVLADEKTKMGTAAPEATAEGPTGSILQLPRADETAVPTAVPTAATAAVDSTQQAPQEEPAPNNGTDVGKITTGGNASGGASKPTAATSPPSVKVPKSLYHGTTKDNTFDTFDIKKAGSGVGYNKASQGDVVYLTDNQDTAKYFSRKANKNVVLNDPANGVGDGTLEEKAMTDVGGDNVMQVRLSDGANIKRLGHYPSTKEMSAYRAQGYDAVEFPERDMRKVTDLPADLPKTAKQSVTTAVFNQDKLEVVREPAAGEPTPTALETKDKGTEPTAAASRKKTTPAKRSAREEAHEALDSYLEVPEGRQSLRSAEELVRLADKLNKAGQSAAIQRRGGLQSKKNLGVHKHGGRKKEGEPDAYLSLQDAVIKDPRMYATVLAHEMSHAIEFRINGSTKKTLSLFGDLSKAEEKQITEELKIITNALEGTAVAEAKPKYYYQPTEMLARYVETLVLHPGKAESLAPLLTEKFEDLVVREPLAAELMSALDDSLDKGFKNFTPNWAKDLRQIYRKKLGKHAGDLAYDAEIIRRAEINRSTSLIGKLMDRKFKGVKDKPEQLFRAAEAVLVTENEQPQFGTHDFMWGVKEADLKNLQKAGWQVATTHEVGEETEKGEKVEAKTYDLSRVRYTPAQAEQIFNELSPEGQQLIKDFTAAKEEAKDEFNRELMKDLYDIDSKLEGWVHHYFDGKPFSGGNTTSLRTKVAAAKKQRTGSEGYVEDFRKAITKAMLELDSSRINNSFISDQLARISKPIAKGDKPEKHWVEVVADGKGGLRLPGEGMQVMIKPDEGKAVRIPQRRYQVPEDLARHYREIRDIPSEANLAARALNRMAKYWTLNVLIHPGSTATNFFSGGLQYGGKVINDFYMDLLTANFSMSRTRNNLIAPMKVLTPRGWTNAPDWLYGGYRSNQVGQYATGDDTKIDRGLNEYGDKMLYVFGLVETYWKKTIALSEGSQLAGASNRRVTQRLEADEQKIIAELNKAIDTYAFDYDNKPLWLSKFDRSGGKILKPFMIYPYKLSKFYTHFAAAAFDKTIPWQERTAKILTLTTIVTAIALLYNDREDKMTTPKGTEKTPLALTPGGRVFVGTAKDGAELFIRTAKYPFFNLTSGASAIVHRNGTELGQLLNEQFGTVGPGLDLFMLAIGKRDQFNQYTPTSAIVGSMAAEWLPGFRIFSDVGRALDDKARAPKNFVQGFFSNLPVLGSEEEREKLRGKTRTIKIPDETAKGRTIKKEERTVTERAVTNNTSDVLLGLLTGIYRRRIDPKEAEAQRLRELRDDAEFEVRQLLLKGNENDATTLAEQYGLEIPNDTYKYYRRLDEDRRNQQIENGKKKKEKAAAN